MYLSKFQLFNYKSFRDSGLLEFTPGINIIVGENNSGKTALLEALSLQFDDFTHRSIKTLPTNLSAINPKSKVQLWLSFEKNEFRAILDNFSSDFLGIYLPDNNTLVPERLVSWFQEWLDPEAIAIVINEEDESREEPLSSTEVQEWLDKTNQEEHYLPKGVQKEGLSDSEWLCKVDGANLLKSLFTEFSEARVEFSKTKHSFELTEWLVEKEPDRLSELAEFLQNVLDRERKSWEAVYKQMLNNGSVVAIRSPLTPLNKGGTSTECKSPFLRGI